MKKILMLLISIVVLTSCTTLKSDETQTKELTTGNDALSNPTSYPIRSKQSELFKDDIPLPYPVDGEELVPKSTAFFTAITPHSDSTSGTIYGKLFSSVTKESLSGIKIYAAEIVYFESSTDYVYSLQENASPQTSTDINGNFVIQKISPNDYVLIVAVPYGSYVLMDTDNNEIKLTVKAKDVTDIGRGYINWP